MTLVRLGEVKFGRCINSPPAPSRWSGRTLPLSYRANSHTCLAALSIAPSMPSTPATNNTPTTTQLGRQPYLGWRSQERLDIGPAYLATPAQRLASTACCPVPPTSSTTNPPQTHTRSHTLPPSARLSLANNNNVNTSHTQKHHQLSHNIKQVADEIQDYCGKADTSNSNSSSSSFSSPSPPRSPLEAWGVGSPAAIATNTTKSVSSAQVAGRTVRV